MVLPEGLYIVNKNVLEKDNKKITQLKKTKWDIVITDEVHHYAHKTWLKELIDENKTKALFLTATPFQLAISELKQLLSLLNDQVYDDQSFKNYRNKMTVLFKGQARKEEVLKEIREAKKDTETLLRDYIVRNQRNDKRLYHIVNNDMHSPKIEEIANFSVIDEATLSAFLSNRSLIRINEDFKYCYLKCRDHLLSHKQRTFVATLLREILSSYSQFKNSETGTKITQKNHLMKFPKDESHPKIKTLAWLVKKISGDEIKKFEEGKKETMEKILVFVKFIGVKHEGGGTLKILKRLLNKTIKDLLGQRLKSGRKRKQEMFELQEWLHLNWLKNLKQLDYVKKCNLVIEENSYRVNQPDNGSGNYFTKLSNALTKGYSQYLLLNKELRKKEQDFIKRQILDMENEWKNWARCRNCSDESSYTDTGCIDCKDFQDGFDGNLTRARRHKERAENLMKNLYSRYVTRDIVASYTGQDFRTRESHRQGFNSPYAPLVLIASSVGEEGIDLQTYCSHIIHYDLEWNAAKMEQREGRVDRIGRLSKEPVKVYFLLCKDTYEERILQIVKNRERWYRLVMGRNKLLENDDINEQTIMSLNAKEFNKLSLDLRPR
ncbi:MAG: hypothetical protein A2Y97_14040 [Nitrospirae bacterium RBG_13_39_12]|nr:MAG: hypothetical protein A2Y97_14040 [Nitrospirae bacterium RBG_13_39_12]